jgi:hypothetical protein
VLPNTSPGRGFFFFRSLASDPTFPLFPPRIPFPMHTHRLRGVPVAAPSPRTLTAPRRAAPPRRVGVVAPPTLPRPSVAAAASSVTTGAPGAKTAAGDGEVRRNGRGERA